MIANKSIILVVIAITLAACCSSKWCRYDREIEALTPSQAKAEVEKLSNDDLLEFEEWQVQRSHPPFSPYRDIVVKRGATIVPTIIRRLEEPKNSVVEMDYIDLIREIADKGQLEISTEKKHFLSKKCHQIYAPQDDVCAPIDKAAIE